MTSDNNSYEVVYCEDDGESRVYCNICDKLCIERNYTNNLKSGTHTNNFYKKQDSIISNSTLTKPKQRLKYHLKLILTAYIMKTNNFKEIQII